MLDTIIDFSAAVSVAGAALYLGGMIREAFGRPAPVPPTVRPTVRRPRTVGAIVGACLLALTGAAGADTLTRCIDLETGSETVVSGPASPAVARGRRGGGRRVRSARPGGRRTKVRAYRRRGRKVRSYQRRMPGFSWPVTALQQA
jgi:hypothetical protein